MTISERIVLVKNMLREKDEQELEEMADKELLDEVLEEGGIFPDG